MAGVILGLALLLALAAKASASTTAPAPATSLEKIIGSGDPRKMLDAAKVISESGDAKTAAALTEKARNAAAASPTAVYPSPFPSVPTPAWSRFVHLMRGGAAPDQVTPAFHLGMFAMGMPRLQDLGAAFNVQKVKRDGRAVYDGQWTPPLGPGPDKFLASPALQYRLFVASMTADLGQIKEKFPQAVGSEIDGHRATPSGLLAVTKQAGIHGLESWLSSPETRQKFHTTTAAFQRANGIF